MSPIRRSGWVLAILFLASVLHAQQGWNPFDIKNRTGAWLDSARQVRQSEGQMADTAVTVAADTVTAHFSEDPVIDSVSAGQPVAMEIQVSVRDTLVLEQNPFEVIRMPDLPDDWEQRERAQGVERADGDLLFVVLLLLLVFLGILVSMYRSFILRMYRAAINENYLKLLFRSVNDPVRFRMGAFYLFFVLNAGLFLYLNLPWLGFDLWHEGPVLLGACILLVCLVYGLKHAVIYSLSLVFPVQKAARQYNATIIVFNCLLGLLLLPFNALVAYGPDGLAAGAGLAGTGLWLLCYFARQFRGLVFSVNFLVQNLFHFFVYLCTVEIAPILIIWKLSQSI